MAEAAKLQKVLSDIPRNGSPAESERANAPPASKRRMTRFLLMGLVLVLAAAGTYFYATVESYQSTDDAFIEGNVTDLAPKIAGRVDRVLIDDNQFVKKSDLLVTIDPRDYDTAFEQKQAIRESFKAQGAAVQATIEQQQAHLNTLESTEESDQATAEADRANAVNAAVLFKRYKELFARRVIASQDLDTVKANANSTQATLDAALKKVAADEDQKREAEYQLKSYVAMLKSVQAMIAETDASLESARLNRSYAEIRAPEDGRITNRTVQPGNYVQVGQVLLSLVPTDLYVIANFKEDQLPKMRSGQPVAIHIDSLPGRSFPGHVHSIQAGSGGRFSLLPAENATGNYVKVVQRVPVKILFDQTPETGLPIGPGESVIPTVKVQDFHYSAMQIIGIAVGVVLILWFINWWETRQTVQTEPGDDGEETSEMIWRGRKTVPTEPHAPEIRPGNGGDGRPPKKKQTLSAGRR